MSRCSRLVRLHAGLVALLVLGACQAPLGLRETVVGSGRLLEQTRAVGDFQRVKLKGAMSLRIEVGPEPALVIVADDNLLEYVETRVRGGELIIEVEGSLASEHELVARLALPELERLRISGRADLQLSGLDSPGFRLEVNGSCAGSLRGRADAVKIEIAGAGRLDLSQLLVQDLHIEITGSGTLEVSVEERLRVDVSGSASVTYSGDPEIEINEVGTAHLVRRKP